MEADGSSDTPQALDCDVRSNLVVTPGNEWTVNTSRLVRNTPTAIISTSLDTPNSEIVSSEVDIAKQEICDLEKLRRSNEDFSKFLEQRLKHRLGSLHKVIKELIIKCISSKMSAISVYIPQVRDVSTLRFGTGNESVISCSLSERSCYLATCSHQKEVTSCRNVNTSVSFQRKQEAHAIPRTHRDDLQKFRSESKGRSMSGRNVTGETQVMEGCQPFLLIMNKYLRVIFVSRNVWNHLGYQQNDMLGHSIGRFVHPNNLSELSRLMTRGQCKSDEDSSDPSWKTGKELAVAMRTFGSKPGGCKHNTGYTQVQWSVHVRLKKQGQTVKGRDLVVLCRSVGADSDQGIHVGGNTIASYPDVSSHFKAARYGSHGRVRKKLPMEKRVFDGIKCFGFTLATAMSALDLEASNYLTMDNHRKAEKIDSQLFLEHLLCSASMNCFVNSFIRPRQQRNKMQLSHKSACRKQKKPWTIMASPMCRDLCPEPKTGTVLDCGSNSSIPINAGESCSAAFNINKNEVSPEGDHTDARSNLTIPNFDRNIIKHHSLAPLDSNLEADLHSNLALLHATTNSSQTAQVSDYSGTLGHCLVMDTYPDQPHTAVDQLTLSEAYTSCDSENSCNSVTYFGSGESSAEDKPTTAAEKMTKFGQSRNSLKARNIQRFINKIRDNNGFNCNGNNRSALTDDSITYLTDDSITYLTDDSITYLTDDSITYLTDDSLTVSSEDSISDLTDDKRSTFTDITVSDFTDDNNRSDLTDSSSSDFTDIDNNSSDLVDNNKSELLILYENLLPSYYFTHGHNQQFSEYECQNEVKVNSHLLGHYSADKPSNLVSSKLSSLLQLDNPSPSLITSNIKACEFVNTSPITSTLDTTSRSNTRTHNIQADDTRSTFTSSNNLSNRKSEQLKISLSSSPTFSYQDLSKVSAKNEFIINVPAGTSQMLPTSTSLSTSEYFTPTNNNQTQNNITSNRRMSELMESTVLQSQHVDKNNKVLSKMTNKNFDPFLSEASFSEMNTQPGTDMFDDLSSVSSSVNSSLLLSVATHNLSTIGQDKLTNLIDRPPSNLSHAFMDSSESMAHVPFASECLNELDSFLDTIPLSPCMATSMNSSTSTQPISASEWTNPDVITNQGSELVSNDSSDSETSSKPSLLRTLLDKEGGTVHGPQTYTEWVLEQITKKDYDIEKTRSHNEAASSRQILSVQRKRKNVIKKSRELPMLHLACGHMKFGSYGPQDQKATKELPLPSSVKATVITQSSVQKPQDVLDSESVYQNDTKDREITTHISSSETATDFSLPDDLLDMAMEYCAPLEIGQAEALISDLNGSCSWEDNLYSLLETSGQEKLMNTPGCLNTPQQPGESASSSVIVMSHETTTHFSIPKENLAKPSVPSSVSVEHDLQNNTESIEEHNNLYHPQTTFRQTSIPSHLLNSPRLSTPCAYNFKLPTLSATDSINMNSKMSLLRAAIISPDVDKLIEQIPFANAKKHSRSSQLTSYLRENDPDIVITKVLGLQKSQVLPSVQIPLGRVNKAPSTNTIRLTENIYKSVQSSNNPTTTLENKGTTPLGHVFTTDLSNKDIETKKLLQNTSSSADPLLTSEVPTSTNPLVIKISLGTNSAKVVTVDRCSKNRHNHKFKPTCQHRFSGHESPTSPRTTNTDLSFTHPVSVMIMRKESHRSRRSKSIAIQTDNLPGEIYPEFEHNLSDTVLYPSVVISYPPIVSPGHDDSPSSTSISSHSSLTELDKFLLSQSSSDDSLSSTDDDHQLRSNSSSLDENYQLGSSSSFLLKLLTGELSKDHYQLLDQQLLDQERKKSIDL